LFGSGEVADYLDQLLELGVSQRSVHMERDIWILLRSASPKEAAIWDRRQARRNRRPGRSDGRPPPVLDPAIAQLVVMSVGVSSPAWDRLNQIAKERTTVQL
jgi:hypothetical protein